MKPDPLALLDDIEDACERIARYTADMDIESWRGDQKTQEGLPVRYLSRNPAQSRIFHVLGGMSLEDSGSSGFWARVETRAYPASMVSPVRKRPLVPNHKPPDYLSF
jgi:hypothetical protein